MKHPHPETKGSVMLMSEDLLASAKEMIEKGDGVLPFCVSATMNVWVSYLEDVNVEGFPFAVGNTEYKIGYKNNATSSDDA